VLGRLPKPKEMEAGLKELSGNQAVHQKSVEDYTKLAETVAAYEKQLDVKQIEWEAKMRALPSWLALKPETATAVLSGAKLAKQPDGSVLASGKNITPEKYTVTIKGTKAMKGITAFRLEMLTDPSLPAQGPGRANNGNFVLNEFTVTVGPEGKPMEAKPVEFAKAAATFSQDQFAVAGAIDGKPETGWAIGPQLSKPQTAVFELKEPLTVDEGMVITVVLDQQFAGKDHNVGKFRLATTDAKPPVAFEGPPEAVGNLLEIEPEKRTPQQVKKLTDYFRSLDGEYKRLQAELAAQPKPGDPRLIGAQNLVWAMINTPEFWFNY
jgi:hypothetical protein